MKGVMGIFNCDECGGKLTYLARSCPHCGKRFKSNLLAADWKLGGKPTLFAACGVAVIWFAVIATSMIWVVSLAHPALLTPVILFLSLIFLVLIYVFGRAFRKQKKTPTDS